MCAPRAVCHICKTLTSLLVNAHLGSSQGVHHTIVKEEISTGPLLMLWRLLYNRPLLNPPEPFFWGETASSSLYEAKKNIFWFSGSFLRKINKVDLKKTSYWGVSRKNSLLVILFPAIYASQVHADSFEVPLPSYAPAKISLMAAVLCFTSLEHGVETWVLLMHW